jgi:hypothetical protein
VTNISGNASVCACAFAKETRTATQAMRRHDPKDREIFMMNTSQSALTAFPDSA